MELGSDLAANEIEALLPDRPVRSYPAMLSTEADALAWARADAPSGALVVAGYQASPRGRAGIEWSVDVARALAFSIILRPDLPPEREGWLYTVATVALADIVGEGAAIVWPDEVRRDERRAAAAGIYAEPGPDRIEWAVVNLLVDEAPPPRAPLVARLVSALERRLAEPVVKVSSEHRSRCATIGALVRARLIPMGPNGVVVEGRGAGTLPDGALVIESENGRRVAVPPQNLGLLEPTPSPNAEYS